MFIRFRYEKLGGHYHIRVFTNLQGPDYTYANAGTIIMREDEMLPFQDLFLGRQSVEFIDGYDDDDA